MNMINTNIKKFIIYKVLTTALFIDAIFTLYAFDLGYTNMKLMMLSSVASIFVILFEVPSGAIADRYSRKTSLIVSSVLRLMGIGCYIFGFLIMGTIVMTLGVVLTSGTDSAYLYDYLKKIGIEKEYQSIEGEISSYIFYYMAFVSITSGFLYSIDKFIPFFISFISFIVVVIISFFLEEDGKKVIGKDDTINYFKIIVTSSKKIAKDKALRKSMFTFVGLLAIIRLMKGFEQPFMYSVNMPPYGFGIILFIANIVAGYTSKRSAAITKITKENTTKVMIASSLLIALLIGLTNQMFSIVFILLFSLVRGIVGPYVYTNLNNSTESEYRATSISFANLILSLIIIIVSPISGWIADIYGVQGFYLFISTIMVLVLLIITVVNSIIKKSKSL